jgi:hypothetical protein
MKHSNRCNTRGDVVDKDITETFNGFNPDLQKDLATKFPDLKPGLSIELHNAEELSGMDIKPPEFIIEDLLPVGVGILAAASKIGKSWMVLDMALAVVKGKPFMGFRTNKCDVLYLALEDSWFRLKSRLQKLSGFDKAPKGLDLAIDCENVQNGLIEQLDNILVAQPETRLVIIDTLQKVKPATDKGKTAYEQDYSLLGGDFKSLATKHNIAILFLHHTRKGNGFNNDPFEEILGSTALQGATDVMFVIKKEKRTDEVATFYAIGRDVQQHELSVRFNKSSCKWINEGDADSAEEARREQNYLNDPIVRTIKKQLEAIEANEEELIKEYVVRVKDIRADVISITGELVGTSERNFATEMRKLFAHIQATDGIRCIAPEADTTFKGAKGRWYRFKRMPSHSNK